MSAVWLLGEKPSTESQPTALQSALYVPELQEQPIQQPDAEPFAVAVEPKRKPVEKSSAKPAESETLLASDESGHFRNKSCDANLETQAIADEDETADRQILSIPIRTTEMDLTELMMIECERALTEEELRAQDYKQRTVEI